MKLSTKSATANFCLKSVLFSLALGALTSVAHAGLMVEPYLGYEVTASTATVSGSLIDLSGNVNINSAVTGTDLGLRLGYKLPALFWVAFDGSTGSPTMKFSTTGIIPDETVNRTVLGVTAGVDIPFLIRAWVGYPPVWIFHF